MMGLFMNPLKLLRMLLWDPYKWCYLKALIIMLLLALLGLFFYSMPVGASPDVYYSRTPPHTCTHPPFLEVSPSLAPIGIFSHSLAGISRWLMVINSVHALCCSVAERLLKPISHDPKS